MSKNTMNIAKGIKRMMDKTIQSIKEPEKSKELSMWQSRLDDAKSKYSEDISKMRKYNSYYEGSREVEGNPNKNKKPSKVSANVWNIVYELIESQVEPSIPAPKVTPVHEKDINRAKMIEKALSNEIRLMKLSSMNDMQERITPIMGGDFMHVEWDNKKGFHRNVGGISISERNPTNVIPQPGVSEVEKMDYLFVLISQSKKYIKAKYGVDVSAASEEDPQVRGDNAISSDELATVNIAYYRNENGTIGMFTWCDDYFLEDISDYQSRYYEKCDKCGKEKESDACECGSKNFSMKPQYTEKLGKKINTGFGELSAFELEEETILDELGNEIKIETEKQVEIPYYKPNCMPIVLRKNVSRINRFLGTSDVEVIIDQQDNIKKFGNKINEKVLGGGSIFTKHPDTRIEMTDEELRVVNVKDPNQKAMLSVMDIKPDVSVDRVLINDNYQYAKSGLGITDSFQGKYDASATSGVSKQYAINQAAGRLESKRTMKNDAYSKLYEMMFKFWLAYADQKIPFQSVGQNGEAEFDFFDRYSFLEKDEAGEYYWNDEFIFETDPTSTIMTNREAMWSQMDFKLQSGAFGTLGDPRTNLKYWKYMEENNYPNAGKIKKDFEIEVQKLLEQEQQLEQMQSAQQQVTPQEQTGGIQDAMSEMPS